MFPELFENDRIVINEVVGNEGLKASYILKELYTDHSLNNVVPWYIAKDFPKRVIKRMKIKFNEELVKISQKFEMKFLLTILNSKTIYWFHKSWISNELNIYPEHVRNLPIKLPSTQQSFIILCDYMLFLNATEERRKLERELIEFLDNQIIDSLVYELYFKEKFYEDKLYPEPKEYLLELVSKYLKPINYDRWSDHYWKKQLEEKLDKEEENEMKKLEEKNLKIIKEVVEKIRNDKEINRKNKVSSLG